MIAERLAAKCVDVPIAGCTIWIGSDTGDGYGLISVDGKTRLVHRLAYELRHGSIPDGMMVLHSCDVRSCCNPEHLFLGRNKENMADMVQKNRQSKGSSRPHSKLDEGQARKIRERAANGETLRSLAFEYGIGKTTVHQITSGKRWTHA